MPWPTPHQRDRHPGRIGLLNDCCFLFRRPAPSPLNRRDHLNLLDLPYYDRHSTEAEKPDARAARSGGDRVSPTSEPVRKVMPFASRKDVTIDDLIAKLIFSARSFVIRASFIALIFATTVPTTFPA